MYGFEMYHEEYVKPLCASFKLFQRANLKFWDLDVSFFKQFWRFFLIIPLMICHHATVTAYIIKLFTEGLDPFEEADMLPLWLVTVQFWTESAIIMKERRKITELIINLGSMWRTTGLNLKQMKIKKAALKRFHYGSIVYVNFGIVSSWQYLLIPFCETVVRRLILNQDAKLQMPFACVYPFEITNWPIYLAVYAFQVYTILFIVHFYQAMRWLLVVLLENLHLQFLLLQEDLIHIMPEKNDESSQPLDGSDVVTTFEEIPAMRMGDFVRRHQDALLLVDKLNVAFNKLTFSNILYTTLLICFFAVAARTSTGLAYILNNFAAIIVVMINVLIQCYCSQLLNRSSGGIANAAAMNVWYKGNLRHQTSINIILMRSQKPCSLTSLDLITPIGLDTFSKIVKTTWSYFSLANHLYDKRN